MKIGTKSILFGVHCFLIHPWFVFWAWCKLYGFPFNPLLWLSFFLHDLGYIGKPNMDGKEGELHPYLGARILGFLGGKKWYDFCLYHSRFLAKKNKHCYSKLCVADKLAIYLTPAWLYLPMVKLTGEIKEYMNAAKSRANAGENKYATMNVYSDDEYKWYIGIQDYCKRWAHTHKNGKVDNWTPDYK